MGRNAVLLTVAALLAPLAASAAEPVVAVTGNVAAAQTFSFGDLRALKQSHVKISQVTGHGPVTLDCSGPAVATLLDKAQPKFGPEKNAFLAHTLLFTADDKYAVALSLAEIDPAYGRGTAIIATDCDGKPEAAAHLVVASDVNAGRALQGLVTIEVK